MFEVMESSLRRRIKEATQTLHDQLDSDPMALLLMSEEGTLDTYRAFLVRTLGFLRPIEGALFTSETSVMLTPWWVDRFPRHPYLERDLVRLGLSEAEVQALPEMASVPAVTSTAAAMGMTYVIEGSMMGGLVMAKQCGLRMGLQPEDMTFFLPEPPKQIVARFHTFCDALDGFAKCDCEEEQALAGATATFEAILNWVKN